MTSSSPEIVPSADSADAQPRFSYKDATHEEVLEDLSRYTSLWEHFQYDLKQYLLVALF